MPIWKLLGLSAFYYSTYPWRRWQQRIADRAGKSPAMILYFHRVADDAATPWTTPTRLFERQIHWLKKNFDLISLEEVQRRLRRKSNHRTAVSITFDDGYAANCDRALPLLVEEQIPCMYFVAVQPVLEGVPFRHDVGRQVPAPPNTVDELKRFAADGIEIGAHTRTHPNLGAMDDPDLMYDEVVQSRDDLQEAIGHDVRYFAFPFGHFEHLSPLAFHVAREAGFAAACSAYGGYNYPGDDAFHLQRFCSETRMLSMKNWALIDPRKVRTPRYSYTHGDPLLAAGGVRS